MSDDLLLTQRCAGQQWRRGERAAAIEREAPSEAALALSYNGRPHTVLMASPGHLTDLAAGFTVTEGVARYASISHLSFDEHAEGFTIDVRLRAGAPRDRRRLADATAPPPVVSSRHRFAHAAIGRALAETERRRLAAGGATYAAAFARPDGEVFKVREDVVQHNALDKLAGALVRCGEPPSEGFILVTGGCSSQMVEKLARLGCPMIVAVAAPTGLAIRKAQAAAMTLVALAGGDAHTVFAGGERLTSAASAAGPWIAGAA